MRQLSRLELILHNGGAWLVTRMRL